MSRTACRDFEPLFAALGHRFARADLVEQALTHPSVEGVPSYQRLEFLGDRVLGLVVAELLYDGYPGAAEGALAARYNVLVRRQTLAEVAREVGLGDYLLLSPSEERSGGRDKPAILADACEAIIAALYRDGGLDAARAFVERYWRPRGDNLPDAPKDAKTALQEWLQGAGFAAPSYREVSRSGPDHALVFTMEVVVKGRPALTGRGSTKQAAEQAAAAAMLEIRAGATAPGAGANDDGNNEP